MKNKAQNNIDSEPQYVPLFALGKVFTTIGAKEEIPTTDILVALIRHCSGDWESLCEQDIEQNRLALIHGERIFSRYTSREGVRFWIITESDRSSTTVLLPSEY